MKKTNPKPARLTALDWRTVEFIAYAATTTEGALREVAVMSKKGLAELRKASGIAPENFSAIPLSIYANATVSLAGLDDNKRFCCLSTGAKKLLAMRPANAVVGADDADADDEEDADDEDRLTVGVPTVTEIPDDAQKAMLALMRALSQSLDEGKVRSIVSEQIRDTLTTTATLLREEFSQNTRRVEIVTPEQAAPRDMGIQHEQFPKLLRIIAARAVSGRRLNAYLCGPAGSGKTRATQEASKALGLEFYLHGAASADYKYLGFVDAGGTYRETGLYRAWKFGGVVCLDEADASSADAIIALNAGLAGDLMDFPGDAHPVPRHADCVVIVCANSWGRGGDRQYSARVKLDEASLNRFVKLYWPIDEMLERMMLPGFETWVSRVQNARARAKARNLEIAITPRDSENGAALLMQGFTEDEAEELTFLAGLKTEQRAALKEAA